MQKPRIFPNAEKGPIEIRKIVNPGAFERRTVIINDKQKEKLIKKIEMIVRQSQEYKDYVKFLKDNMEMNQCAYLANVTNKYSRKIRIEIHHEPFNLFQIVETVLNKWIREDWNLNPLLIAEEVMEIHFRNNIGLIPLSKTVHDLTHNGVLFIPLQAVFGGFASFAIEYDEDIKPEVKDIIQEKLNLSREITLDKTALEKRFVYLDVDGVKIPSLLSEEEAKKARDAAYNERIKNN